MVETDVAARLSVSRTPVRAALQRLEREGYLVSYGGAQSRLTVAPLTLEDARELVHIVGELEGLAARHAAMLPTQQRRALAAQLRSVNASLGAAAQQSRPKGKLLQKLDLAFHRLYLDAGAGARVLNLLEVVKPQAERYGWAYASDVWKDLSGSLAEHEAVARAIDEGDPDDAQRAVRTNWHNAAERLARVIASAGERGRAATPSV